MANKPQRMRAFFALDHFWRFFQHWQAPQLKTLAPPDARERLKRRHSGVMT
jgi:hypothetical protein